MILLNSQMDLYYNLRNICLVLFAVFAFISIIYGTKVHILTTIQRYFGIEKRREIAKRREGGYKAGNTTARMRYAQLTNTRNAGAMVAGAAAKRSATRGAQIDVSQVKTEKMPQTMRRNSLVSMQKSEETVVLSQESEETVVLSQESEETVVLSQESEDTLVLSQENEDTVVLSQENEDTVVLSPSQRVVVRMQEDVVVVHGEDI